MFNEVLLEYSDGVCRISIKQPDHLWSEIGSFSATNAAELYGAKKMMEMMFGSHVSIETAETLDFWRSS